MTQETADTPQCSSHSDWSWCPRRKHTMRTATGRLSSYLNHSSFRSSIEHRTCRTADPSTLPVPRKTVRVHMSCPPTVCTSSTSTFTNTSSTRRDPHGQETARGRTCWHASFAVRLSSFAKGKPFNITRDGKQVQTPRWRATSPRYVAFCNSAFKPSRAFAQSLTHSYANTHCNSDSQAMTRMHGTHTFRSQHHCA